MKSNDLRPGLAVKVDGKLYVVTEVEHRTPGNLRAFIQAKLKGVPEGSTIEKRLRSGEEVEAVDLDRRDAEYLYDEADAMVMMDLETYDQFHLSHDLTGNATKFIKPNTQIQVLFSEGNPVSIELPKVVDLVVKSTTPQVKGATATNQLKEATMETGLDTKVPPFIEEGETLRISTADGSYMSRASG